MAHHTTVESERRARYHYSRMMTPSEMRRELVMFLLLMAAFSFFAGYLISHIPHDTQPQHLRSIDNASLTN